MFSACSKKFNQNILVHDLKQIVVRITYPPHAQQKRVKITKYDVIWQGKNYHLCRLMHLYDLYVMIYMYMDIGLLGPLATRRPHGVLKMWQLIEAAMRTPWERLQPSDKAVKPLWPMWHVTTDSWCALSKLKMVRKCLSYEHKNKTYWQKCHHDAVFDMNTNSEFAPWPNLLLGFVRTRVLMSRSRLNNGATHGGWHFDIHRDFDTRER